MTPSWFDTIAPLVRESRYPPSACTREELVMLSYITQYRYLGRGAVCDLGCGKGGSTFALCLGLSRNGTVGRETQVHAYDWLEFSGAGRSDGDSESFWTNVAQFKNSVILHAGDLLDERWNGGDIEILFVDIAKNLGLFQHVVREFFSALVPGLSLIIHQDFGRPRLPWLHYSTGALLPYVEVVGLVEDSLVLKLLEPIPDELRRALIADDFSAESRITNIRRVQSILGDEITRGFSYREILGLSEAFVHHYSGDNETARTKVRHLGASDAFMDHFGVMVETISSA